MYASPEIKNIDRFELPPLPPNGIFDVRFASNKMMFEIIILSAVIKRNVQVVIVMHFETLLGELIMTDIKSFLSIIDVKFFPKITIL